MALFEEVFDVSKQKMTQLKTWLEEMEVQMALGKAEARDLFDQERRNFSEFLKEQKNRMQKAEEDFESTKAELIERFDKLEEKLGKDLAENKETFEAQKTETLEAIYELEASIKEKYGEMAESFQERLDVFKAKLDGYRVQLALGKYEAEDLLEDKKTEVREAIRDVRDRLAKEDTDKMDAIGVEFKAAFDHFRKAVKEMVS